MGVLMCARGDCDGIMCNRYSNTYGYICDECFNELVAKGVRTDIEQFMRSDKQSNNTEAIEIYFDSIFPDRH